MNRRKAMGTFAAVMILCVSRAGAESAGQAAPGASGLSLVKIVKARPSAELQSYREWVRLEQPPGPEGKAADGKRKIARTAIVSVRGKGSRSAVDFIRSGVTKRFQEDGLEVREGVFKNIASEGAWFDQAWNGNVGGMKQQGMLGQSDRVALVKAEFSPARGSGFKDIITVDGTVSILVMDGGGVVLERNQWSSPGAGVTEETAARAAAERIVEQMSSKK